MAIALIPSILIPCFQLLEVFLYLRKLGYFTGNNLAIFISDTCPHYIRPVQTGFFSNVMIVFTRIFGTNIAFQLGFFFYYSAFLAAFLLKHLSANCFPSNEDHIYFSYHFHTQMDF